MIKVTLELVSAISPDRSKVLGVGMISNNRDTSIKTNGELGTYKIEFTKSQEIDIPNDDYNIKLSKWEPKLNQTWKKGTLKNFDRSKRGAWDLLYLALKEILADRNR